MSPKKEKKKRKKKRKHVADGSSSAEQSGRATTAIHVSLDAHIAAAVESSSPSWGSVFAAAAAIQPEELDQDFLRRTEPKSTDLAAMSRLAHEQQLDAKQQAKSFSREDSEKGALERKKRKRKDYGSDGGAELEQSSNNENLDSTSSDISLEGRMVPHPSQNEEQVMVLVDMKNSKVYSALKRTEEGELIPIGSLVSGKVVFDSGALSDEKELQLEGAEQQKEEASGTSPFPFDVDPDDHCESPLEAYQDIVVFLETLNHNKKDVAIYDPYYCNGAVVRNLTALGFPNVHNQKQDCYKAWSTGIGYPQYNVLLTNPPYSSNHIEKLLQHVTSKNFGDRPWLLLLPTWVHKKEYYKRATANVQPFYVVPRHKRYIYLPPKDFRTKKASDVHKKSSPFVSMWYIWGGTTRRTEQWINLYQQQAGTTCDLARSRSALRDLRRKGKKKR